MGQHVYSDGWPGGVADWNLCPAVPMPSCADAVRMSLCLTGFEKAPPGSIAQSCYPVSMPA